MKITINGADADIRPEKEKTAGEVLSSLESWLAGSGYRLSGLCVNGETISANDMEACFLRDIDTIETLDLRVSSLTELFAEGLIRLLDDIAVFEETGFNEKSQFMEQWKESPQARLLSEQASDLFAWAEKTFSGEGCSPPLLRTIAEERLREVHDPVAEMGRAKSMVSDICTRLEELPLDMQTGKDSRAVETVSVFSSIAEKVFRIFNILKVQNFPTGEITVNSMPIAAYISEFSTELQELLSAYEQRDTVLVGDIAEYEMAPRLRSLFLAILEAIEGDTK